MAVSTKTKKTSTKKNDANESGKLRIAVSAFESKILDLSVK